MKKQKDRQAEMDKVTELKNIMSNEIERERERLGWGRRGRI